MRVYNKEGKKINADKDQWAALKAAGWLKKAPEPEPEKVEPEPEPEPEKPKVKPRKPKPIKKLDKGE